MAVTVNTDECIGCGACEGACPSGAISVSDKATVNADECVDCGACVDECAVGALSL